MQLHKVTCWLQLFFVGLVTSVALTWLAEPAMFNPKYFAEPNVSVNQYIDKLRNGTTEWQRYNAAAALGELGDKSAIPALVEALKSSSDSVRENALNSLGELEATETLGAIEPLLDDTAEGVRANASQVIEELRSIKRQPRQTGGVTYLLFAAPAALIIFALILKLRFYPCAKSSKAIRIMAYLAWPAGVVLAWLAQQPHFTSDAQKTIGIPFQAALLNQENGVWLDYIGPSTTPILALDILYVAFSPQVLLAFILCVAIFRAARIQGRA